MTTPDRVARTDHEGGSPTSRPTSDGVDLLRLLVKTVRDYAIFVLDPTGHVASWNDGAQRIKGYSAAEIIGRHFSVFYPEEDIASGKPKWELERAAEQGRFEDEGWRVRKDGSRFWANVVITALRDEEGKLVGFAKVSRDLTERRAAEQRAMADARRLAASEAANKAKSEFLAAMSHELRTPLNAIAGFAELMEIGIGGSLSEQQRKYLNRIRTSQHHLLGIVNDLLNYSRIESGQITYDITPVPVHDMVDVVIPLVEPQALSKGLTLEHGPCVGGLVGLADRLKAEQVVLNLLSNAMKYTPSGGRVVVACCPMDDRVGITVRDTGPGIPLEKQQAIFEPFVQLGRSFTSPQEGAGLGLAISRDLARAMGGDVIVESEVDRGSAFTLVLPKAEKR